MFAMEQGNYIIEWQTHPKVDTPKIIIQDRWVVEEFNSFCSYIKKLTWLQNIFVDVPPNLKIKKPRYYPAPFMLHSWTSVSLES